MFVFWRGSLSQRLVRIVKVRKKCIVLCKKELQIESYAPKWFWIALLLHGHCMYCLAFFQLRISWDNKSITKYFQVIMNEIVEKYNFFQIFSCHSSLPGNILASLIKSLYSSPFEKVIVTTKWTKQTQTKHNDFEQSIFTTW